MITVQERFEYVSKEDRYSWKWTTTFHDLLMASSLDKRKKISKYLELDRFFWTRFLEESIDAVVEGSDSKEYMLGVRLDNCMMGCECPSFKYNSGPCKHLYALMAKSLSENEENVDRDPKSWLIESIVAARNTMDARKPWMSDVDISPWSVEFKDGVEHGTKKYGKFKSEYFILENGKKWTGPLPLPEKGQKVQFYKPSERSRGSDIEGVITGEYEKSDEYQGYWVKYKDSDKDIKKVIFGTDIEKIDRE